MFVCFLLLIVVFFCTEKTRKGRTGEQYSVILVLKTTRISLCTVCAFETDDILLLFPYSSPIHNIYLSRFAQKFFNVKFALFSFSTDFFENI